MAYSQKKEENKTIKSSAARPKTASRDTAKPRARRERAEKGMNRRIPDSRHPTALFLLAGTALLWSFGGVLIKWVPWHPLAIAGVRSTIALPLLLWAFRGSRLSGSVWEIAGAIAYSAVVILFVSATKKTTAANAIMLQSIAPALVAVFSGAVLGEPVRRVDWAVLFLVGAGMALFFFDKLNAGGTAGNVMAVGSGVAFATMILCLRKQKHGTPLASVILGNAITALVAVPFLFGPIPGRNGWIGLLLLGFFQIGLSYILYTEAIRHVTALEASLVPMLEPVLNPVWVFVFLGEKPGRFAVFGGILVIGSVVARSLWSLPKKARRQKGRPA